jgi:ribosomal-protein-alanine N-acetyltransferase
LELDTPITIRRATAGDLAAMMHLERQCPTSAHWTEEQYHQLFAGRPQPVARLVLLAEANNPNDRRDAMPGALGFLVARHVAFDWELENIVVSPSARRKGLGKRLLDDLLHRARDTNSDSVFLEVRESNAAARSLYEKAGFQLAGRRRSYYNDPPEDAFLYRLRLR